MSHSPATGIDDRPKTPAAQPAPVQLLARIEDCDFYGSTVGLCKRDDRLDAGLRGDDRFCMVSITTLPGSRRYFVANIS
jgi:hypothetical protein